MKTKQKMIAAVVVVIVVVVAVVGVGAFVLLRGSPSENVMPATAPVMDIKVWYRDEDYSPTWNYPGNRGYGIADDNIVWIDITHVGGGRVYAPTTDLTCSFALVYKAWTTDAIKAVSAMVKFPDNIVTSTGCTVTVLFSGPSAENFFEEYHRWILKVVPDAGMSADNYAVHENTAITATVVTGGKTPVTSAATNYCAPLRIPVFT